MTLFQLHGLLIPFFKRHFQLRHQFHIKNLEIIFGKALFSIELFAVSAVISKAEGAIITRPSLFLTWMKNILSEHCVTT